jgi:hypothetical protein
LGHIGAWSGGVIDGWMGRQARCSTHHLSGESPILMRVHRAQCFCFQKTQFGK